MLGFHLFSSYLLGRMNRKFFRVDSSHDLSALDRGARAADSNKWFFEVAWEVANKGKVTEILKRQNYHGPNKIIHWRESGASSSTSLLMCKIVDFCT